ncbi:MAG TPA: hypothetical protein VJM74_03920 [Nitrososphaeraceae archaeon]|nr:hypothetical protein [Nitrososphaeraceae archaeon]
MESRKRSLIICTCVCMAALLQIIIESQTVTAIDVPASTLNKNNYGIQLESNVTNSNSNEVIYRNPQHGIFMLFPSNWTFSTSGLPQYTQVAAFYAPLQNLSDLIPARFTITVMSYQQNVSLKEFTNMTLSSLNETNQVKILNSNPTTLAGRPGYQVVFSTLPNMGSPVSFKIMHSWTVINNKIYVFEYGVESSKFNTYLPTVKQILDSLKIEAP